MKKIEKIFGFFSFCLTVFLSFIGAVAVGRALISLTVFGSVVTGFPDPVALFILNLGNVVITIYVFFRLYQFFEYLVGKFYLFFRNLLVYVKVTTRYLKELKQGGDKK